MFVCGIGFLTAHGVAGVAAYVIGHGFTKGALFMLVGILLHRFGTVDEFDLHGRGRELRPAGVLFGIGGLVLSALPGVTAFFGKSMLDGGAIDSGYPWLPAVFVISSILTGGAVLRAAGRVFLGWGASQRREDVQLRQPPEQDEERIERDVTPPLMLIVPGALLLGAIVIGLIPGPVPAIEQAAGHFTDHASYATWVLQGRQVHYSAGVVEPRREVRLSLCAASTVGAVAIAGLTLFGAPLRRRLPPGFEGPPRAALPRCAGFTVDISATTSPGGQVAAAMLGGASLLLLT